jgi:hypothetical protein
VQAPRFELQQIEIVLNGRSQQHCHDPAALGVVLVADLLNAPNLTESPPLPDQHGPSFSSSAIFSITFNCAKAAKEVHRLVQSCIDASRLIPALSGDCSLIGLTLSRFQILVQQDDEYASVRFQDEKVVVVGFGRDCAT